MYTVEESLKKILASVAVMSAAYVALADSPGHTLAEDVYADIPLPPFTNSAVDGYAVRAGDTTDANERTPLPLVCIEEIPAGAWPARTVRRGECARIMTGAPLPPGADAVVMVEDTRGESEEGKRRREEEERGKGGEKERVLILEAARAGQHVRFAGGDAQAGERMLAAGELIRAAQIGLLAQMGRDRVMVTRLPRVAVISTGDEVVEIASGVIPPQGKIRNSNGYALEALVREAGAIVHSRRHIGDDLIATQAALRRCAFGKGNREENRPEDRAKEDGRRKTEGAWLEDAAPDNDIADVIVTAGGVSVGDRDFVRVALESMGTLELWRVAMKPGKPVAFGRIGRTLFFGLPGNPVSAHVTFELFVRPALKKMAGVRDEELSRRCVTATLLADVPHVPPRREYVRARTEWQNGRFVALPLGGQGSANMATLARANSLLIVPEQSEGVKAGEILSVLLLE